MHGGQCACVWGGENALQDAAQEVFGEFAFRVGSVETVLFRFYRDCETRSFFRGVRAGKSGGELCRVFPELSAPLKEAARLYVREYLIPGSRISAPYHLLPAGIFRRADMLTPDDLKQYEAGTQINEDYAIRTFPIWKDHIFHGATNFHLSQAWALASAARLLEDEEAMNLAQEQLEWTLGRNPFGSSLMYGVGYNYAPGFVYCTLGGARFPLCRNLGRIPGF